RGGSGDTGKIGPESIGEHPVIDDDIIGLVRSEHAEVRINRGGIARDDDRVRVETFAGNSSRLRIVARILAEVERIDWGGAIGHVVYADLARISQDHRL